MNYRTILLATAAVMFAGAANAEDITAPMYLPGAGKVLSSTSLQYERTSLKHNAGAGEDFRAVFLLAGRHDVALPRPAPVQLPLNGFFRHRDEGRTAVNHHAYPGSMGFTPGGDSEHLTKTAGHGGILDGGVHPVKPWTSAAGHKKTPRSAEDGVLKEKCSFGKQLPS